MPARWAPHRGSVAASAVTPRSSVDTRTPVCVRVCQLARLRCKTAISGLDAVTRAGALVLVATTSAGDGGTGAARRTRPPVPDISTSAAVHGERI